MQFYQQLQWMAKTMLCTKPEKDSLMQHAIRESILSSISDQLTPKSNNVSKPISKKKV